MSLSRVSWIFSAVAPWCLAFGVVLSCTAEAGQEAPVGASVEVVSTRRFYEPADLVPQARSVLSAFIQGRTGMAGDWFQPASLGGLDGYLPNAAQPEKLVPKIDFKRYVRPGADGRMPELADLPQVERSRKGDPLVSLRPAFDARLPLGQGFAHRRVGNLVFGMDDGGIASAFQPYDGAVSGPETVSSFEPWPEGEGTMTASARADISPRTGSAAQNGTSPHIVRDGATPAVARAVALGSSTPVALESRPMELVAMLLPAKLKENATAVPKITRPDFASLLDPTSIAREKRCLAEAVYFEARSESEAGQAAVAQVVLNRVNSGLYPENVCGVVYQNRHHYNACQFSFACEGKSLRITEPEPWAVAVRIAEAVTSGQTYSAGVGAATHYHANYVRPRWARQLKKMDKIGTHIFYKLRPGQT